MKRVPTDREILEAIYARYYEAFAAFSKENPNRETKNFVPVDLEVIAAEVGVDKDIVFGRLYYHLEQKYGYKRDGLSVHFFARVVKNDRHCVNFPLMASVLASLQTEHLRFRLATTISIVSLTIAVIALVISIFNNFWPTRDAGNVKAIMALVRARTSDKHASMEGNSCHLHCLLLRNRSISISRLGFQQSHTTRVPSQVRVLRSTQA